MTITGSAKRRTIALLLAVFVPAALWAPAWLWSILIAGVVGMALAGARPSRRDQAEFQRMVQETPAGRTVQLAVLRDAWRVAGSDATVRTHVSNILGKLHLASRTQAALYALREGLARLDK